MKKVNYRLIFLIIGLIAIQSILYFLSKLTPFPIFLIGSEIDNKIPLIKEFIYLYFIWYLMLLIIPYTLYKKDKEKLYQYVRAYIICIIVADITFFFIPTTINRGSIVVNDVSSWLVNFIYKSDTPALNCLPSMHCVMCFLFMYYISACKEIKIYRKVIVIILSIGIILSTLFVEQHVVWDVIAALIVSIISITAVKVWPMSKLLKKIFRKLSL